MTLHISVHAMHKHRASTPCAFGTVTHAMTVTLAMTMTVTLAVTVTMTVTITVTVTSASFLILLLLHLHEQHCNKQKYFGAENLSHKQIPLLYTLCYFNLWKMFIGRHCCPALDPTFRRCTAP